VNTSRTTNYELRGTGWATRAPVAQTLQTVRQTCSGTTATLLCLCARFPSCGIFAPTETNELKQQGDGASEHLKNDKLRVAGHGLGNTRACRTNTAKRAPNMPMYHHHLPAYIGTVLSCFSESNHTLSHSSVSWQINSNWD
jgi:hypothetical protein